MRKGVKGKDQKETVGFLYHKNKSIQPSKKWT